MPGEFPYNVFLSYSAKDKRSKPPTLMHDPGGNPVVRDVAERLRKDGLLRKAKVKRKKAEVPIHPSSFKLHPMLIRLSHLACGHIGRFPGRKALKCANPISTLHPFPDWAQLESGTFRFRDPLNKERRFRLRPQRLDAGPKAVHDFGIRNETRRRFS